jgi:hypothetical protein
MHQPPDHARRLCPRQERFELVGVENVFFDQTAGLFALHD